jgi:single-strand DNA-binding protein
MVESLAEGHRAMVIGRLRTRSWETQDGDRRWVAEIDAEEAAPSLRWATAKPQVACGSAVGVTA